ncbi:MAG: mandelate racemase/muconate lactonizing enzyme family protein [Bryobacteraceae bacterium]|nr:mandelate racemase/muconate lactonizing enzyme family protein [Bryobacteraceae bacterium]
MISRREFAGRFAMVASAVAARLRAVAATAKPVRIRNVQIFPIEISTSREELEMGKYARYTFFEVETDAGVSGYCFDRGSYHQILDRVIRPALVGKDLFAVEEHLRAGLGQWGGVEQAIWDAIGKIAGQPVHRLLGGSGASLKVYLTCIWKGKADQSHVPYKDMADVALKIRNAGYRGMKIRAWRPNAIDDADACGEIRAAAGADFTIMVDRTADLNGLWNYSTALSMARALEKHNVAFLEEPFARDDFYSPARLSREVDIQVTGGERFHGLDAYRESFVQGSYDVVQPDVVLCGGVFMVRKIAAMAQAFHKPVVLHGSMGLRLAGWLQASAAIGAEWQELALITPPLMPEEQWSPALKVLNASSLFTIRDGHIEVPQGPGLGLDVNREAVARYRIPDTPGRSFYPQYPG